MTKHEIKSALEAAENDFNDRINEQIRHINDEGQKQDFQAFASAVLDCFGDYKNVIMKLGD